MSRYMSEKDAKWLNSKEKYYICDHAGFMSGCKACDHNWEHLPFVDDEDDPTLVDYCGCHLTSIYCQTAGTRVACKEV